MAGQARVISEDQAKRLFESKFWERMSMKDRALFQLFTERLCMPFGIFHEAVEALLGRSVWSHEFGLNVEGLRREALGEQQALTFEEIVAMIPEDKRRMVHV